MPFGIDQTDWDNAKVQAIAILGPIAKAKDVIAYSALCDQIKAVSFSPHAKNFAEFIGELSREENRAGRGMLSVLIVHKDGEKCPGLGFFELAKELGRDTSDQEVCWIAELNKVHGAWK